MLILGIFYHLAQLTITHTRDAREKGTKVLTKSQERKIIAGLMVGLFCLVVTAWYWFVAATPNFDAGVCWLAAGVVIMLVVSVIELRWQRRSRG